MPKFLSALDTQGGLTLLDAKGDLVVAAAGDVPARLAVGADGQLLTADSTAATGAKWVTRSSYVAPKNVLCDTAPAHAVGNGTDALVSGTLRLYRAWQPLGAGIALTSLAAISSSGATTPTNQWFCLVRLSDMTVIAVTVNDTSTAWAANSRKLLAIASGPFTPIGDTPVAFGVMVAAATPPGMRAGTSAVNFVVNLGSTDSLVYNGGTGYTTPPSLGTVITPAVGGSSVGYMWAE